MTLSASRYTQLA